MPTPGYMSIQGETQGNITEGANSMESMGNRYQEGHENEITVQGFSHQIMIPRDPQSGQPSGQRVHDALVISKIYDKSSPKLFEALTSGERLPRIELKWFRTSMTGQQEHYFTHVLEDAMIVDIKAHMPNCQDPAMEHFTHMEDVSFTYRKISWTHEVAGTSGSDDWRVPKA
ncbi:MULTISPECIES: Hcp family type VI secretion system effector [Amphritea]|jgi:type VI secretion system secreted protein Hcp|uniref:Type VI secretion system secreted protein Hcp n=2 Tax=Amphritea TaxID=515417 RepID=A0A1H9MB89_9GAMM|nr:MULTISPECIES: Hcp family type VI secretion system effector [Amphritea]MBN0986930.1 Hcp family type VI secretion system effector [Amphritea pacifica]MBN1006352.1 Hcp family type VI secretion system effector [Amphritea pacifica]SER21020.1 type VI secretion system secreted protein Hcp [Amphritea atlantica]